MRKRRSGIGRLNPYKRIMLMLSIGDVIVSVCDVFQSVLVPRGTSKRLWAMGNSTTCTAIGAIAQFGFCSLFYNAMLNLYFLLTVLFKARDRTIAK